MDSDLLDIPLTQVRTLVVPFLESLFNQKQERGLMKNETGQGLQYTCNLVEITGNISSTVPGK
jgi:hypothetical protein